MAMIHQSEITGFKTITHETDFCVVGGGVAGLLAAVSAARHGVKVVLMNDRPVLGGNASSEIRMWIRGAHGENNRETGILEEIALENIHRNPSLNFSVRDSVLYELAVSEPNLELISNCSCNSAETEGEKIISISGWQTTTQQTHKVSGLTQKAEISGSDNPRILTNGLHRTIDGNDNAASCRLGEYITAQFGSPEYVKELKLIFDSDINRQTFGDMDWNYKTFPMRCNVYIGAPNLFTPKTIVRSFDVEVDRGDGKWEKLFSCENNYQRLVRVKVGENVRGIRICPTATHGAETARIYEIELL